MIRGGRRLQEVWQIRKESCGRATQKWFDRSGTSQTLAFSQVNASGRTCDQLVS